MTIKDAKKQILNAIDAYLVKDEFGDYKISIEHQRPVFLLGAPGIGKTAIMEQIAQDKGINLITYSMAHQTRDTAMGLPVIVTRNYNGYDTQVSEYTMSEIIANIYTTMEDTGIKEGILFLDEINCVSPTLSPIMLQFLQYKIFGLHQVPPGWVIVTAGNPPEYNKSVNEFDMATWDRLKKVNCVPELGCWMEYAYMAGVHPSIISYLTMHNDHFYEVDPKEKKIVTSRAWEDLSEMMQLYEEKGIYVSHFLISQYLQDPVISKSFSDFYNRFNDIREKYDTDGILDGNISQQAVEYAKHANDEEIISVMELLLDGITFDMRTTIEEEKMIRQIHPRMEDIVCKISEGCSSRQTITEHIMDTQKKLNMAIRARNISRSNKKVQHWILHNFDSYIKKCTDEGKNNKDTCIQILQNAFVRLLDEAKTITEESMKELHNTLYFFYQAFGAESPVMKKLVAEIDRNCHITSFITKYGSDEFYQLAGRPVKKPKYNNIYELNLTDCLEESDEEEE